MKQITGISLQGKSTTELVVSHLSNSFEIKGNASVVRTGDVCWPINATENIIIEVKKNTGNQVRPLLYNVLVIYSEKLNTFYVIPPDDVMKVAASRNRGQHSEIALECFNFGLTKSRREKYKVSEELSVAIKNAYAKGMSSPLKNMCTKMLNSIVELKNSLNAMVNNS